MKKLFKLEIIQKLFFHKERTYFFMMLLFFALGIFIATSYFYTANIDFTINIVKKIPPVEFNLAFLLRDLHWVLTIFWVAYNSSCKNDEIRKFLRKLAYWYAGFVVVQLLVLNNYYSTLSYAANIIFTIISVYVSYRKFKKKQCGHV